MAYAIGPAVVVVAGNSGDAGNSGVRAARTINSEGHSLPGEEARMPQKHPEADSECYMRPRTADMVFGDHCLQQ